MLVWMAERGHKFYVKDLVQYLREEHGYHGCDANVRRGLVKGGFKRKLVSCESAGHVGCVLNHVQPWHKSEVTTWIPPDHAAVFVTNVEGDGEGGKSRLPKEVNPALDELPEDFNNSERQTPLPVAGDGAVYAVAIEGQAPAGLDEAMSLDARSELIDPLLDHPQANITPITNPTNHALTVANTPSPVPLPETTDHLGLTDPANLASQVLTLQEENARQQDLILALQQQLAESQARVTGDTASQGYSLKSIRLGPSLKEVSRYSSPYAVMPGSGEA